MAKKTRNARIVMKGSNIPGVLPTIPYSDDHTDGTWLDTDIYTREFFVNDADRKLYIRMGNIIVDVDFVISPNFTITNATSESNEQSVGNKITVTGTGMKDTMTATLVETGVTFSNVNVNYLNDTTVEIIYDATGDISADRTIDVTLNKEGYELSFTAGMDADAYISGDSLGGNNISRLSSFTFTLTCQDMGVLTDLVSNNPNVIITTYSDLSSTSVEIEVDTSGATPGDTVSFRITAEDGDLSNWYNLSLTNLITFVQLGQYSHNSIEFNSTDYVTFELSEPIYEITDIEIQNVDNYSIMSGAPAASPSTNARININSTNAKGGEVAQIRFKADGDQIDWVDVPAYNPYYEADLGGAYYSITGGVEDYFNLEGWDGTVVPELFFKVIDVSGDDRLYAYETFQDMYNSVAGTDVFYVDEYDDPIIITNASPAGLTYSGEINVGNLYTNGRMKVEKLYRRYTMLDEVGDYAATNFTDEVLDTIAWNYLLYPVLYCEVDASYVNIYPTDTDRTNQTNSIGRYIPGPNDNFISALNGSTIGGVIFDVDDFTIGDKFTLTKDNYFLRNINEVGTTLDSTIPDQSLILGWDKATYPYLYFEVINVATPGEDRLYAFTSEADRTTGISAAVFYIADGTSLIVEENTSGFYGDIGTNIELNYEATPIYLTVSGGTFPQEKWCNITTGINNTGVQHWGQGDGTLGNGAGLITDEVIYVDLATDYYMQAWDDYGDTWESTVYELNTAPNGAGTILANNGGVSPDASDILVDGSWYLKTSELFNIAAPTPLTLTVNAIGDQMKIEVE